MYRRFSRPTERTRTEYTRFHSDRYRPLRPNGSISATIFTNVSIRTGPSDNRRSARTGGVIRSTHRLAEPVDTTNSNITLEQPTRSTDSKHQLEAQTRSTDSNRSFDRSFDLPPPIRTIRLADLIDRGPTSATCYGYVETQAHPSASYRSRRRTKHRVLIARALAGAHNPTTKLHRYLRLPERKP